MLLCECSQTDVYQDQKIRHVLVIEIIGELPKLCVKITIFMQGHVLIADWYVAYFVVIMNDVMNDNMVAFAHVGARLDAFF